MKQRENFVEAAARHEMSMSALCREYGISRKTGYKWLNRASGGQSLADKSRRPHVQPAKTPQETERLIVDTRAGHPAWGGKKIKSVLEAMGHPDIPSAKTCGTILKRNGCIHPEEALKHKPYQRFAREHCNELWQTDFKGDFLLADNSRCYPLDILDDRSRFCIRIDAKSAATGVKDSFIRAFREFGLPDAILSDNGSQFSGFRGGYTQFERFLMDLDVTPIHGRIMHPQTQGKIERFHRTMKQEALRTMPANLKAAQACLDVWRQCYNELRPHAALNMKTPASLYKPSKRAYFTPAPFVYDTGAPVIKVNNWGYLRFGPVRVYLSETMRDTYLQIRAEEDDTFSVIYRNYRIARIDAQTCLLIDRHIRKL